MATLASPHRIASAPLQPEPQPASTSSQTITLPDGRILGYAVYGQSQTPNIPVILYFHGFPTSRLEAEFMASTSVPVTIIAIDRPGMGLSTFQPSRKIIDWPSDVLALVDHLHIEKFHIIGGSGGSPYALTCTIHLPKERVLNTAIVSGIYPLTLGTAGMLWPVKAILYGGAWLPTWMTRKFLELEFGGGAVGDREEFERKFMKAMESRSERDRRCLDDFPFRKMMIDSMREAFRQGSEGAAWECGLYGQDWGFKLEDIEAGDGRRVVLWHGRGDINAPVQMAEKASRLMKGCELRVVEEETHLSMPYNCVQDILRDLLGPGQEQE